jgi:exosome complex component RRP41
MQHQQQQLLSPEGLRLDGRKPSELRRIQASIGQAGKAEGSAYLEVGNTKIHCSVFGPREATGNSLGSQHRKQESSSILNVELNLATFGQAGASGNRARRNPKYSRKNMELCAFVRSAFESVILSSSFSRSSAGHNNTQIDVFVQVLQSDGSLLSCIVNAVGLALVDAGVPMQDWVSAASVSAACSDAQVLISDPNWAEECTKISTLTVAVAQRSGEIVACSSKGKFHIERLPEVVRVAVESSAKVHKILDAFLLQKVRESWKKRTVLHE